MVSTNASGNRAVKYGTTKHYVLDWKLCWRMEESSKRGRSLGRLLRDTILPNSLPMQRAHWASSQDHFENPPVPSTSPLQRPVPFHLDAGKAASEILTSGIALSSCEILDKVTIDVVNKAMGLNIPGHIGALLFIEIDGNKKAVEEDIEKINAICKANHGLKTNGRMTRRNVSRCGPPDRGLYLHCRESKEGQGCNPLWMTREYPSPKSRRPL